MKAVTESHSTWPISTHLPCSSRNFSASIAAMQPVPAAVMACLYRRACTSPPAERPGNRGENLFVGFEVSIVIGVELAFEHLGIRHVTNPEKERAGGKIPRLAGFQIVQ